MSTFVMMAEPLPMFPSSISIGGATIKLFADGSWEGDAGAFEAALKAAKQTGEGFTMPLGWLVMNAIRKDR